MFNPSKNISSQKALVYGAVGVGSALLLWATLSGGGFVSPAKLPTPWAVASKWAFLMYNEGNSQLIPAAMSSLWRIAVAGVLMLITGIPLGIAMGASKGVNAVLSPLVDPFRSAPIVAFIPIFVMWFGIGETMKIMFLWLGAVVYLVPMVRDAIVAVDPRYFKLAVDRGATDFEALFTATVPAAMPRVADSIITSVALMWTYITVAELVNADSGLGKLVENYRKVSQMDAVFAIIITIIVIALVTYQSMVALRNWRYSWEKV